MRHGQHCFLVCVCKKPIIYGSTEPRIAFSAVLFGITHFIPAAAVGVPPARRQRIEPSGLRCKQPIAMFAMGFSHLNPDGA